MLIAVVQRRRTLRGRWPPATRCNAPRGARPCRRSKPHRGRSRRCRKLGPRSRRRPPAHRLEVALGSIEMAISSESLRHRRSWGRRQGTRSGSGLMKWLQSTPGYPAPTDEISSSSRRRRERPGSPISPDQPQLTGEVTTTIHSERSAARPGSSRSSAEPALADVTLLGWPGGPEEAGAAQGRRSLQRQVRRDRQGQGQADPLQSGWAPRQARGVPRGGREDPRRQSPATYAIGRDAPFDRSVAAPASAKEVSDDKALATMQYQGKQYGVLTDLSPHFLYYRTELIRFASFNDALEEEIFRSRQGQAGQGARAKGTA